MLLALARSKLGRAVRAGAVAAAAAALPAIAWPDRAEEATASVRSDQTTVETGEHALMCGTAGLARRPKALRQAPSRPQLCS
eukprot:4833075-Pleurochrysis_carterae.AAC.1